MALLKIRFEGDECLRKECRPVDNITPRIHQLLDDMRETLLNARGVGLAAPQIGILRRIVLVDNGGEILELINPVITEVDGEQTGPEGCLSCPGKYGTVTRPMSVSVKALNRKGEEIIVSGTELTARAMCHEIDHLNGILYVDKAEEMFYPEEL